MRTYPLILLMFWSSALFARGMDESTMGKYFIHNQVGANQGLYALGLGYQGDWFEPSLSLGYLPPFKSGAAIYQTNLKANFKILTTKEPDFQWLVGTSLLWNLSNKTFYDVPAHYPKRYYPPNAYYFALQTSIRHHGFYVEASIIDYFLEVAARNKNSMSYISDLYSVGFGYGESVDWEFSDLTRSVKNWF